ncbi:hypothetical protein GGF46_005051 [Coemansia sp. RSA 552]|nr:hypothetical protein GGF46_005051 [Coemansia sp. RSA 552]
MYAEYFVQPSPLTLNSNSSSASSLTEYFPPLSPGAADHPSCAPRRPDSRSRLNFAGSWLDLESDDDDDVEYERRTTLVRMRRKNSGASAKDARNPLANIRELTHRGSVHIRKLTGRMYR